MFVTESGIMISRKSEQLSKAEAAMLVTFVGKIIDVSPAILTKTSAPSMTEKYGTAGIIGSTGSSEPYGVSPSVR